MSTLSLYSCASEDRIDVSIVVSPSLSSSSSSSNQSSPTYRDSVYFSASSIPPRLGTGGTSSRSLSTAYSVDSTESNRESVSQKAAYLSPHPTSSGSAIGSTREKDDTARSNRKQQQEDNLRRRRSFQRINELYASVHSSDEEESGGDSDARAGGDMANKRKKGGKKAAANLPTSPQDSQHAVSRIADVSAAQLNVSEGQADAQENDAASISSEATDVVVNKDHSPQHSPTAPNSDTGVSTPVGLAAPISTDNGTVNESKHEGASKKRRRKKGHKDRRIKVRNRKIQVADIEDDAAVHSQPFSTASSSAGENDESEIRRNLALPPNQYETVLRRRAIRKLEPEVKPPLVQAKAVIEQPKQQPLRTKRRSLFGSSTPPQDEKKKTKDSFLEEEIEGDVSLGMSLTILGGRVIIQNLNALSDGRASPAQLTGVIQRGDVLLSIDGLSLVHLPVEQLVEGLKPLSSPEPSAPVGWSGMSEEVPVFRRSLRLRFSIGEGLPLLKRHDRQQKVSSRVPGSMPMISSTDEDNAGELFFSQLFKGDTLVDNLSGLPLFKEEIHESPKLEPSPTNVEPPMSPVPPQFIDTSALPSLNQTISVQIALQRKWNQRRYTSLFYSLDDRFSELLRASASLLEISCQSKSGTDKGDVLTHSELVEQGKRAMIGAVMLCKKMEDTDKAKEKLPSRAIGSNGSLYSRRSRASTRRRPFAEPVSEENSSNEDESLDSGNGSSVEERLLVELAAHDHVWRQQVLEALGTTLSDDDTSPMGSPRMSMTPKKNDGNLIGNLFFGEQVSKILTSKKRSTALPPEDLTDLLFDLTTQITAVMPEAIDLTDAFKDDSSLTSSIRGESHQRSRHDIGMARLFLTEEAFPAWLKSFRPLPWFHRRMLWPASPGTSPTSESFSALDDDLSVSVTSESTGWRGQHSGRHKDLKEQIEDLELDSETRAETCYLATFYFTHKFVPKLRNTFARPNLNGKHSKLSEAEQFVKTFGAYLKLHSCLVCAAEIHAESIIPILLDIAKHDMRHRDALKLLSKKTFFTPYEPSLLSAILKLLPTLVQENPKQRETHHMMPLLVAAYPDLRPWQVRKAATVTNDDGEKISKSTTTKDNDDFYYNYLSLLLHPEEGSDTARRDSSLVEEWCRLSVPSRSAKEQIIPGSKEDMRLKNFLSVASKSSDYWMLYRRDLPLLLNFSMGIQHHGLALDLALEIIAHKSLPRKSEVMTGLATCVRLIARIATQGDVLDHSIVRRALKVIKKMSESESEACRKSVSVPDDIYNLLVICGENAGQDTLTRATNKQLAFVTLISNSIGPKNAIEALSKWDYTVPAPSTLVPALHTILLRGAQSGASEELSGALLRIQHARGSKRQATAFSENGKPDSMESEVDAYGMGNCIIWRKLYEGTGIIDK